MPVARGIQAHGADGKARQMGVLIAAVAGAAAADAADEVEREPAPADTTSSTFRPPSPSVDGREITLDASQL